MYSLRRAIPVVTVAGRGYDRFSARWLTLEGGLIQPHLLYKPGGHVPAQDQFTVTDAQYTKMTNFPCESALPYMQWVRDLVVAILVVRLVVKVHAKQVVKTIVKPLVKPRAKYLAKLVVNLHARQLVKKLPNQEVGVSEKELQLMSGTWRNKIISLCQ